MGTLVEKKVGMRSSTEKIKKVRNNAQPFKVSSSTNPKLHLSKFKFIANLKVKAKGAPSDSRALRKILLKSRAKRRLPSYGSSPSATPSHYAGKAKHTNVNLKRRLRALEAKVEN